MKEKPMHYLLEDWLEKRRVARLHRRARQSSAQRAAYLMRLAEKPVQHRAIPGRGGMR